MSILTKKSILVTGGTGSIGTALVKKGLIRKIDDETIKDAYGLTARGIIIADELFSKLTKP